MNFKCLKHLNNNNIAYELIVILIDQRIKYNHYYFRTCVCVYTHVNMHHIYKHIYALYLYTHRYMMSLYSIHYMNVCVNTLLWTINVDYIHIYMYMYILIYNAFV